MSEELEEMVESEHPENHLEVHWLPLGHLSLVAVEGGLEEQQDQDVDSCEYYCEHDAERPNNDKELAVVQGHFEEDSVEVVLIL